MKTDWYLAQLFHGRGLYHIETIPMIRSENQWTGFYIRTSIIKKLRKKEDS